MPYTLSSLRVYEDKRVKMRFDDEHECIATFLSASQNADGSLHLVYDKVEWANDPREMATAKDATVYAEGEALLSIDEIAN